MKHINKTVHGIGGGTSTSRNAHPSSGAVPPCPAAGMTNCHKCSGLTQHPFFISVPHRAHGFEVKSRVGPCSSRDAPGKKADSTLVEVVGKIQFFVRSTLPSWLSGGAS